MKEGKKGSERKKVIIEVDENTDPFLIARLQFYEDYEASRKEKEGSK